MTSDLIPVNSRQDILPAYRDTPIGELLGYHALREPKRTYAHAQMVIVACMDSRVLLDVPRTFAYFIRTAGARTEAAQFGIDFAVSVAGVEAIAVVGHDDCAMTGVGGRRDEFVRGLQRRGWSEEDATEAFTKGLETWSVGSSRDHVRKDARRLAARYPGVIVAPLYSLVRDGALVQVDAGSDESA